ncbi:MAG: hypothetical protein NC397_06255 [Clostridium sp.]|nr:hypothetical protein [Clostridium sp.]
MDNREYVCTFDDKETNVYDFAKTVSSIKFGKNLFITILPLYVLLLITVIFLHNIFLSVLSIAVLALILFIIFGYQKLFAKILIRNSKKLYGNQTIENKITFGEKIVITAGENRTVLEYSSIKRITESGNIYALFLTGTSGTYFEKNSCADATDAELLAMLSERTGVKISNKSKRSAVITAIVTAVTTILSILSALSIFYLLQ